MINPGEYKPEEESNLSNFQIGVRMLPIQMTLGREVGLGEIFADGNSTPLRAGIVRLPRLRLLDKHFKLETVPIYSNRRERSNRVRSYVQPRQQDDVIPTQLQCSTQDRFIPRRKGHNLEAAYHYLVTKPPKKLCGRDLDLPNDLNSMGFAWQKRSMSRALQTVIPGSGSQHILQLTQQNSSKAPTVPGSLGGRPRNFEESSDVGDEYKWPVKPRRRPVIGQPNTILDIPHFRPSARKNLLDWSLKNMIAAVVDESVCVVNGDVDLDSDDTKFLFNERCTAVKFSNSGDKIAIGRESSVTSVYSMTPNKVCYEYKCVGPNHPFSCQPQAYAWSNDDRYLVIGCSGGFLTVTDVQRLSEVKIIQASVSEIVTIAMSPNDRYIVCSGRESAVRIFTVPDLTPYMEIRYYGPIRAIAWHPWDHSILCIGAARGDGGLSVWNVQRQISLAFRRVNFDGCVDTLAWNKVTGELMVNWFVREGGIGYVAMPVYASFDRITDAIVPTSKASRILYTAWSPDGAHIACQSGESVFMHNFLDSETKEKLQKRKKNTKSFTCYSIR